MPNRGPDVLTIPTSGSNFPLKAYTPFKYASNLSALESFFRGAFPALGTRHNLSSVVTWSSSDPTVLAVSSSGDLMPVGLNCTAASGCPETVTASYGRLRASVPVIVFSPLSITVANISTIQLDPLPKGDYQQFGALVAYPDGFNCGNPTYGCDALNDVAWNSTNNAVIEMNPFFPKDLGLVKSVASSGSSTISCTLILGSVPCSNTVTLSAGPAALTSITTDFRAMRVAKGGSTAADSYTCGTTTRAPFVACGRYSDGTFAPLTSGGSPAWTATPASMGGGGATIVSTPGSTFGQATGTSDGIVVIQFTPSASQVPCTGAQCISYLNVGLTGINPINGTGAALSIPKGETSQLDVTGTFSDAVTRDITGSVNWQSATPTNVKVNSTGLVTTVGTSGSSAVISGYMAGSVPPCSSPFTYCRPITVNVLPAVLLSIAVTPSSPTVPLGANQQFKAIGTYSDGSTQNLTNSVSWNTTNASALCFSNCKLNGNAVSLDPGEAVALLASGTANVTAMLSGVTSNTVTVTVAVAALKSLNVTPKKPDVPYGSNQQFTAKGTFTDGFVHTLPWVGDSSHATASLTWSVSAPNFASINTTGLASTVGIGPSNIIATSSTIIGSTLMTVVPAALKSIAITTPSNSILQDQTTQFTATGTFTDGSQQDLTQSVTWNSDTLTVATISNNSGSEGLATGVGAGNTTITATDPTSGITSPAEVLSVAARTLLSITVTPPPTIMASAGSTVQLTATGNYSNLSTQDLTHSVQWTSDTPAAATVNSSGLLTAVATGTANISATYPPGCTTSCVVGMTSVSVSQSALVSITVAPVNASVAVDFTLQYSATGNYEDGSTFDLTNLVTWSTATGGSQGSIDNTGLLTGSSPGPDTVIATCPANGACPGANSTVSGNTPVTITF